MKPVCITGYLDLVQNFCKYELMTFDEFKRSLSSPRKLRRLLGREIRLHVYDLGMARKPFLLFALLWTLSLSKATVTDIHGKEVRITLFSLLQRLVVMVQDYISFRFILIELQNLLWKLDVEESKSILDMDKKCLYLRSDLRPGLQPGGSITHIAGVLNHLSHYFSSVELMSSDQIPTVDQSIKTCTIPPLRRYWDFDEIPSLLYNFTFYQSILERLQDESPGLIYQRYSLNNLTGVQLSQKYSCPFVVEYNGPEIWMNHNWGKALNYKTLSESIEILNLHNADLIVVVSEALQDQLVQRGIAAQKILVNPNGVDANLYSPSVDGSAIHKQYQLKPEEIMIGFIGTFGKWHGVEILADAFGQLLQDHPELRSHLRLLLIGDGATMAKVQHILKSHRVMDRSVLTGLVPQEAGPKYLAACDILASPHVPNPDGTPFFGSPTKLFEYMAMGKAIIASDLDQIGEVLEHDRTAWMVAPGQVEALRDGLLVLIQDPERRQRLGTAARKEVLAKYTWAEHTQRIMTKIQALCSTDA